MSNLVKVLEPKCDLLFKVNLCAEKAFNTLRYTHNYPHIFKSELKNWFVFEYLNESVAAFCTLTPMTFYIPELRKSLKGLCLGSVCTHPDFQKQGLGRKVLDKAQNFAKVNAYDFLFLFGQDNDFYKKSGFLQIDKTYLGYVNSDIYKHIPFEIQNSNRFVLKEFTGNKDYYHKIWQFIVKNSNSNEPVFSFLDFCDIQNTPNLKCFALCESDVICAIGYFGKGVDFQDTIHSVYAQNHNEGLLLISKIYDYFKQKKGCNELSFFPGSQYLNYKNNFVFFEIPNMFIKIVSDHINENLIIQLVMQEKIFIPALQSC